MKFPEGLGTLILDLDAPGVEIEHATNMFGRTQAQFFTNGVVVPEENVLTRGPDTFKEQLKALNRERPGNAALSNGTAACVFDTALEYAGRREQFGQPIGEFQGIEWKLADMAKRVQTSRNGTLAAASAAERAESSPTGSAPTSQTSGRARC